MSDKNNSGLEVVAHRVRQSAADEWEFMHGTPMNCKIVEPLVRLSDAEAALAAKQEKFSTLLAGEHALSDSYVRIREMVGAMDPPSVTDAVALYAYVEAKVFAFAGLNAELVEALRKIAAIENEMAGGDWEEIEAARVIARAALLKAEGAKS